MTRLLVAGTGLIGARHMQHIAEHPHLTLAGVIDPDPTRRPKDIAGFAHLDNVDVDADGLVLATPTDTHADLTVKALERGLHVLVEKPIAHDLAAADRIIDAARRTGRHVLTGHHRRHHPRVAALKDLLASGDLGRPVTASLLWTMKKPDSYFDVPWRQSVEGAPVRMNLIHEIDLLRWFFGEVEAVAGFGSNAIRRTIRPESGGAVVRFSSGVIVTIAFADTTPTPWGFEAAIGENPNIATTGIDNLRIACTAGGVSFPSLRVWSGASDWSQAPLQSVLDAPDGIPLIRQLEHFADVIAGRTAPLIPAQDGKATLAATLAIEAATLPEGDAA